MDKVLFSLGGTAITAEIALYAGAALFAALLIAVLVVLIGASRDRAAEAKRQA